MVRVVAVILKPIIHVLFFADLHDTEWESRVASKSSKFRQVHALLSADGGIAPRVRPLNIELDTGICIGVEAVTCAEEIGTGAGVSEPRIGAIFWQPLLSCIHSQRKVGCFWNK